MCRCVSWSEMDWRVVSLGCCNDIVIGGDAMTMTMMERLGGVDGGESMCWKES